MGDRSSERRVKPTFDDFLDVVQEVIEVGVYDCEFEKSAWFLEMVRSIPNPGEEVNYDLENKKDRVLLARAVVSQAAESYSDEYKEVALALIGAGLGVKRAPYDRRLTKAVNKYGTRSTRYFREKKVPVIAKGIAEELYLLAPRKEPAHNGERAVDKN